MSTSMLIAIQEIAEQVKEGTVKEKLKKAMKLAYNHWLVVDESDQIKAAVGAVMLNVSDEDKELLKQELQFHQRLTAGHTLPFLTADQLIVDKDTPEKWFGLPKIWKEVKRNE